MAAHHARWPVRSMLPSAVQRIRRCRTRSGVARRSGCTCAERYASTEGHCRRQPDADCAGIGGDAHHSSGGGGGLVIRRGMAHPRRVSAARGRSACAHGRYNAHAKQRRSAPRPRGLQRGDLCAYADGFCAAVRRGHGPWREGSASSRRDIAPHSQRYPRCRIATAHDSAGIAVQLSGATRRPGAVASAVRLSLRVTVTRGRRGATRGMRQHVLHEGAWRRRGRGAMACAAAV